MNEISQASQLIADRMKDPDTQWSLGTFGAIAEFSRDVDEEARFDFTAESMSALTRRGGIRIAPVEGLRPFASESISKLGWNHRIALCLPEASCAMNGRTTLTELGADAGALRSDDKESILFDLGLGAQQADLCVRIADSSVVAKLRDCVGRAVFEAGNPAMSIILAASPHRVFMSRIGRVEVYQPIPPAGCKSPDGPHTHVLPKLLRHRRRHAATEPIPEGWVPCAHLYPPHPLKDAMGRIHEFDEARHNAFQEMLARYGDPAAQDLKARIVSLVNAGTGPDEAALPSGRSPRTSIRLALRQLKSVNPHSAVLQRWLAEYDRVDDEPDDDQQVLGH
jgi:hypothetical protein